MRVKVKCKSEGEDGGDFHYHILLLLASQFSNSRIIFSVRHFSLRYFPFRPCARESLLSLSNRNRSQLTVNLQESHRCPHVNERLNSTLISSAQLKEDVANLKLQPVFDKFLIADFLFKHQNSRWIVRNQKSTPPRRTGSRCPHISGPVHCRITRNQKSTSPRRTVDVFTFLGPVHWESPEISTSPRRTGSRCLHISGTGTL